MKKKDILFIHQNFPGQFRHVAAYLVKQSEYQVKALGQEQAPGLPDIELARYRVKRGPMPGTHHYIRPMEQAVLTGQAVAEILIQLKRQGFNPTVVIAHPGWGESLFVKEVFPTCKLVHYCEWYYRADGADVGFDPDHRVTLDDRARIRAKNAHQLLALDLCDIGIAPTQWQKSQFPEAYHHKIQVIHEGIDTDLAKPDLNACFTLSNGQVLTRNNSVITYVARNLEPYRGFPQFMHALELAQKQHATIEALIIGGDGVSYGRKPSDAANWREHMSRKVKLDPARTHFLGKLPYHQYLKALQISRAHVYLTYPFVLSWSLLEAIACGAPIIASDTAPVREFINDGENGTLVGFFKTDDIATAMTRQASASNSPYSKPVPAAKSNTIQWIMALGINVNAVTLK
ncbi:glycosyltransferase family 4 protein [Chitiniphilus purpureus]|uniref:Glycosyltransferase family 4 protein n=1 Tax=Chitiniphilus purpureus TaxID=2981137 RepID=A0ABY6DHW7_9NEIS|nr:glycosyltransferase family 4 protein [Chitiniphilus sp. CD1]UXY13917.1 glycosyltransferase family 4 protein [Chitiniphilus sp. CD1]